MWTRRALLIYPINAFDNTRKDTIAQAFVTHVSLETFTNERLMFEKAAAYSGDYGATETHRAINTALTPALADALKTALSGASGYWYLLDADTEALLDTNDSAKAGRSTLDWQPGQTVTAGEVLRRISVISQVRSGTESSSFVLYWGQLNRNGGGALTPSAAPSHTKGQVSYGCHQAYLSFVSLNVREM